MTAPGQYEAPSSTIAAPAHRPGPLGLFSFLRQARDNAIAIYEPGTYARDVTSRRVGLQQFVLLNQPDYIQHVLVRHPENYPKGRLNRRVLGPVLGDGLLTSEGETWRRRRRTLAPAFHQRRLAALAPAMVAEVERQRIRWEQLSTTGAPCDMMQEMMALTMRIAARTLFSFDVGEEADRLGRFITTLIDGFGRPSVPDLLGLPEWLPLRRSAEARRALQELDSTIYRVIAERRAGTRRDDLLDMLLEARDEETGAALDDRELRDEVATLFVAGYETTSLALTWTWYLLALHPQAEARLHQELSTVLAGRPARLEDLDRLSYTRMVFEEAMRLFPPAFSFNRVALREDQIGPHRIPKGALVYLSPWVTHRNPNLWPQPTRFEPARFLPEAVRERHKYAYFPFGGGPRVCIGNSFAMNEGRLALATLAQGFAPRMVPDHPVVPQGRVTLRPQHGMMMTLESR